MLKFSMTLAFPIRRSLNPRIACRNWPPETSLLATPAAIPQTPENKTTLSPAFIALTFASSISLVFAALTKNTGGGVPSPTYGARRTRRKARNSSSINRLLTTPVHNGVGVSSPLQLPHSRLLCHNRRSYQRRHLSQRCTVRISAKP
jgi:hypothetical protein